MFSGDVLFQGSIGRADLAGGNFDELKEHIFAAACSSFPTKQSYIRGTEHRITVGIEKAENPFFR